MVPHRHGWPSAHLRLPLAGHGSDRGQARFLSPTGYIGILFLESRRLLREPHGISNAENETPAEREHAVKQRPGGFVGINLVTLPVIIKFRRLVIVDFRITPRAATLCASARSLLSYPGSNRPRRLVCSVSAALSTTWLTEHGHGT